MAVEQWLGLAAGIVGAIGYIPYVRDILRRDVRPDRVAWLIWAAEYVVLFAAQVAKGATSSLWLVGLQLGGVLAVCGLSFRYGAGKFDRRRQIILAIIGASMVLWWFTNNPATALCISVAIEASGIALTIKKAYLYPDSETSSLWMLGGTGGVLGVFSVGGAAPRLLYVYPVALAVMCYAVVAAKYIGLRRTGVAPTSVLEAE